ncbi:MAG: TatD family hydrolase [Pseudomonadota bacterium]
MTTDPTQPLIVDSHVNLHAEQFSEDLDEVVARARDAGVGAMLAISDKIPSRDAIKRISDRYPFIWRSVGAHPHYAVDHPDLTVDFLTDLCADADVIGVGECGLDFHYNYSPEHDQKIVFQKHIEAAQRLQLPLIIHTREADEMMMGMLEDAYAEKPFVPLLHCYTGGLELATRVIENMGGYVSFSGILTFKKADDVRLVAEACPLDRIIVETDCPYLAPVPYRGRRAEPAHTVEVVRKLAEVKDISFEEAATRTTDNFFSLFTKADRSILDSAA